MNEQTEIKWRITKPTGNKPGQEQFKDVEEAMPQETAAGYIAKHNAMINGFKQAVTAYCGQLTALEWSDSDDEVLAAYDGVRGKQDAIQSAVIDKPAANWLTDWDAAPIICEEMAEERREAYAWAQQKVEEAGSNVCGSKAGLFSRVASDYERLAGTVEAKEIDNTTSRNHHSGSLII